MSDNTEHIDAYLNGEMPEEEKLQFERLLSDADSSLKDEMELQRDIILAIQERGLRSMLQRQEAAIRSRRKARRRIAAWCGGLVTSLAVAAVIIFTVIIAPMAIIMSDASEEFAVGIQQSQIMRGGADDEIATLLSDATTAITQDDWSQADKLAAEIMKLTSAPMPNRTDDERLEYYEQAEWIHLNCLMHSKRVLKAKRLLKTIANRGGYYSEQAMKILNQL